MKYAILTLMIQLLALSPSKAQNEHFNTLSPKQGLSHFSVSSIYIDEKGEIWIATRMGLNCYNGTSITTYNYQSDNPYSLVSNSVQRVVGDGRGAIYLLCADALVRMDLHSRHFYNLVEKGITSIAYYDKLYFSIGNKLYIDTSNKEKFQSTLLTTLPKGWVITNVLRDSKQRMWIGTMQHGAYLLEGEHLSQPIKHGHIETFYEDSAHNMWVGTWTDGCYEITPKGNIRQHGRADGFGSNFFRTFCEDNVGNLWMGTADGLLLYKPKTGKKKLITPKAANESIIDKSVWCIAKDKQGTLWIGTYFGGVNYMNPAYQFFTHHTATGDFASGLSSNIVGSMTEDNDKHLWICTEGGGLNMMDLRTHTFAPALPITRKTEGTLNLKAVHFDSLRNVLWIGTHLGGLVRMDISNHRTKSYRYKEGDKKGLPSDIVRNIIGYGRQLVVGTQQGVALFDPDKEEFTTLMPEQSIDHVSSICLDKSGKLWVATESKGLYVYNMKTRQAKHYISDSDKANSIGSNNLNHVYADSHGRIWIATSGNGILLYRPQSDDFEQFGDKNQLVGSSVYTLVESTVDKNRLLLITNKGFSTFIVSKQLFHNYLAEDGFPLSTANEQALYVTHDGMVCLGSIDGMFTFYEDDLLKSRPTFNLNFSRLFVSGKEVLPLADDGILKEALPYLQELTLRHTQKDFSIELASTNSIDGNGGELFYRLRGYQDDWTRVPGNQQLLSFMGLPAGFYTLELRSSTNDMNVARLNIKILPPWYLSWWAYIVYAITAILSIRVAIVSYRRHIRLQEQLKYNRRHIKDVEQMNKSKVEFFTNISHEIRTPLTVIVALAESLLHTEHFPAKVYNKVLSIYKNSSQLKELLTELLDFRKHEEGRMRIKVAECDFPDFVQQTCLLFKEYAISLKVKLTCEVPEHFYIWIDGSLMQKVLNNLLSNAIKYTPKGGLVTVRLSKNTDTAQLEVINTGKSIHSDEIKKIFENFYQTEHPEMLKPGTGLGLKLSQGIIESHHGSIDVISRSDECTKFIVLLPLGKSAFAPNEISTTPEQVAETTKFMPLMAEEKPTESQEEQTEGKSSLLVVEDTPAIMQLLVELLSPYYNVNTATDGRDGFQKAKELKPDLILSDVVMPNMSGIELCRQVKRDFELCHIPVLLLTARNDLDSNLQGVKNGADDYIVKPFDSSLLITKCNNMINTRRMLQRKFSEHPTNSVDLLANNPIDKRLMEQAIEIIERNYCNPDYSVEDFARDIGLSRTALFTKWKQLTGDTPKSFILRHRLRKTAEMLRSQPETSIADISARNGFASSKYFCKCFKDYYHVQPTVYRAGNTANADESGIEGKKGAGNSFSATEP